MKKGFTVSLLVLTGLVLMRFAFPQTAKGVRDALLPYDSNLSEAVIAVGRDMAGGGSTHFVWFGEVPPVGFFSVSTVSPVPSVAPTPQPTPAPSLESPPAVSLPDSAAIDDFWAAQEAFAGNSVPDTVSLLAPTLSFSCAAPVDVAATDGFGFRLHPIYGDVRFHNGADYPVYDGSAVKSFADGSVSDVSEKPGFGHTLTIDHGGGFSSFYAHLQSALVSQGDWVSLGQTVALSGHSGNVTGPHLHFCVLWEGKYINPLFYV